jgi:hypothetical protein
VARRRAPCHRRDPAAGAADDRAPRRRADAGQARRTR